MLRMRSRNSAGSSSRALRTRRAKRARRRSDIALPLWGRGGGARRRVALAERVEDLTAYPARRVCAERGAAIAAVPPRGLHEADDTPRDEILAVVPAAARVERARRDGPRERKVRDDALVARRLRHASPPAADPRQASGWCQ